MKLARLFLLGAALLLGGAVFPPHAGAAPPMTVPADGYLRRLDNDALLDPAGVRHSTDRVRGRVVVILFSIPDLGQGDNQKRWSALLADDPDTRLPKSAAFALIEDMAQAGFPGLARDEMRRKFSPGERPVLLLDEKGAMTKRFGIPRDRTQVLIYDKSGILRHVETRDPTPAAAADVKRIVTALAAR